MSGWGKIDQTINPDASKYTNLSHLFLTRNPLVRLPMFLKGT